MSCDDYGDAGIVKDESDMVIRKCKKKPVEPIQEITTLCRCCPHYYPAVCDHTDTNVALKRLCAVISDSEGRFLLNRQSVLLNHYLGLSTTNRVKLVDIPYMSILLEYFSENLIDSPPYKTMLWSLLTLCQSPPYLTKASDARGCAAILGEYYSALGNCLIFLEDSNIKVMVMDVIHNLLTNCEDSTGETISFANRKAALGNSLMGDKLLQLIKIETDDLYIHILDLTLKIVILSKECAQTLLLCDAIYWLLLRLPITEDGPCKDTYLAEVTSTIIWKLFDTLGQQTMSVRVPFHQDNLKMLKTWLRSEVLFGKPIVRNDVAALICRVLYIYPYLEIFSSGVVDDICLLALATEFGTEGTWAQGVKFLTNQDNLELKKMLILCICYHYKKTGIRMICETFGLLPGLAICLNPYIPSLATVWPSSLKWELMSYALHILPVIAEYQPQNYIECSITTRILFLLEHFSNEKKCPELIKCCLHCIHSLLLRGIGAEHFRQHLAISVVLSLCYKILKDDLTLKAQINITYCFFILTILHQDFYPEIQNHQLMSNIALEVLRRLYRPNEKDSLSDGSFMIASIDYTWNCVILNKGLRTIFIKEGGIYLLLDLASVSSIPIQSIILGALADATLDGNSIPQTVTWRGRTEQDTILSLLCTIWRKQELVKGVKRDQCGCLSDFEQVLEGEAQAGVELSLILCPEVVELCGCLRPKIFAIHSNIFRLHYNIAEHVMRAYMLDCNNIPLNDKITLELIIFYEYFKKSEIWSSLRKVIKQNNWLLLPQSEAVVHILAHKHLFTAVQTQKKQKEHYGINERNAEYEEEELYKKLKSCMLGDALRALHEIKFELFCCDSEYSRREKQIFENKFKRTRRIYDFDENSPYYHKAMVLGMNLSTDKRNSGIASQRISSSIQPKEFAIPKVVETPVVADKLQEQRTVSVIKPRLSYSSF